MNDKELAIYIGQKIKEYRQIKKFTQKELATIVGIGDSSIANYEKGIRTPKKKVLFKLANAFNITIDDLFPSTSRTSSILQSITETSSKLEEDRQIIVLNTAEQQLDEQNSSVSNREELFEYDYYDQPASAGTGQYLNDVNKETVELPVNIDADFVIPIYGDSMEPEYHSGDYAFIKLSVDLSDGSIGVFDLNGDAYIKELRITNKGSYLHSLNQNYPDIQITENDNFRVIGTVVGRYGKD